MLAYRAVRHHRRDEPAEWRIAAVNLAGCVLFGVAAIAGYFVPSTGTILDLAAANWTTSLGALCFLIGAVLILPRFASTAPAAFELPDGRFRLKEELRYLIAVG